MTAFINSLIRCNERFSAEGYPFGESPNSFLVENSGMLKKGKHRLWQMAKVATGSGSQFRALILMPMIFHRLQFKRRGNWQTSTPCGRTTNVVDESRLTGHQIVTTTLSASSFSSMNLSHSLSCFPGLWKRPASVQHMRSRKTGSPL